MLSASVWLSGGFPQRFPQLAQVDYVSQLLKSAPCQGTGNTLNLSPPCYDASDSRPSVATWGDSHSLALAPGLRALANAHGYGFVQLHGPGCAPLTDAANYQPIDPRNALHCIQYNRRALEFLRKDSRVRIVFLVGSWGSSFRFDPVDRWLVTGPEHEQEVPSLDQEEAIFRRSLAATIQDLLATGKQVVVVKDVPIFESNPMFTIRTAQIPARRMLATWMGSPLGNDSGFAQPSLAASVTIANTQLKMVVNSFQGVQLLDLYSQFCRDDNECVYRLGNRLLYGDEQHLSPDGANYALRNFHF